ncbi:hypothetical protein FHX42_001720 [Saccharopolyspora lacisalsi]|uniref:Uncharacterized protein n=1 Tax=Halosaccharopolyspora lacisalsi TaxID=1000566 RepID=A0A839DTK5_9PSEU|nr:hypothetical protein [Halosaccharopolyspora lacisalsi]MBA8824373.1 hypothetical protein [Halosaccharopolyspora lacisalsi]
MDESAPREDSPDHGGAGEYGGGDPALAEDMRSKSAGWLLVAEQFHPDVDTACDRLDELGFDSTWLRGLKSHLRQQALLLHSMLAAQARAYEDMLAAGGPNDPEAYSQYKMATDFNLALLARPDEGDESGEHPGENR